MAINSNIEQCEATSWPSACATRIVPFLVATVVSFSAILIGDSQSAFGSCGHYVYTQLEWKNHQAGLSLHKAILDSTLPSPKPCDGPGCRRQDVPTANVLPSQNNSVRNELVAIVDSLKNVNVRETELEFFEYSQSSSQGFLAQLFRPPRV